VSDRNSHYNMNLSYRYCRETAESDFKNHHGGRLSKNPASLNKTINRFSYTWFMRYDENAMSCMKRYMSHCFRETPTTRFHDHHGAMTIDQIKFNFQLNTATVYMNKMLEYKKRLSIAPADYRLRSPLKGTTTDSTPSCSQRTKLEHENYENYHHCTQNQSYHALLFKVFNENFQGYMIRLLESLLLGPSLPHSLGRPMTASCCYCKYFSKRKGTRIVQRVHD
jgi:hypothetical protein